MKRTVNAIVVLATILVASVSIFAQGNSAAVGTWDMALETPQGTRNFPFSLKEVDGKLVPSTPFKSAEVKGDAITMHMTVKFQDSDLEITYTGKITGDTMSGDADFGGLASGTWAAKRKAEGSAPAASGQTSGAANVTGTWNATVETQAGTGNPTFVFKQDGEALTGNYKGQLGEATLKGTVKGADISFSFKVNVQGQDLDITYTGKVNGDSMSGKVVLGSFGEGTWTAKKAK
ncbi:MAG: hypothetical protein AB1757_18595 [Acidobacteriota bacterium]